MSVKLRKVGNSYVLTVPNEYINKNNLRDGQEMSVSSDANSITFSPVAKTKKVILWDTYENKIPVFPEDISPETYIRKMRDEEDRII